MPWIGALIAARSAPARIDGLGERMFGSKCVFRPNRVWVKPCSRANASVLCDEGADAGEALEIAVDDRLAFVLRHAEPPGDAPRRAAVEDREVDRLGLVARVAVDPPEQLLGGQAVDVDAVRGTLPSAAARRPCARRAAARSGCSRRSAACSPARRRRRRGSCGRSRCGSGCSAGWGRSTTAARSARRSGEKLVWTRPVSGLICACSASV